MAVKRSEFPPEPKVVAATAASGIVGFLLDLISNIVQNQDTGVLIGGAIPEWLEPFVSAFILAVPTFIAGYQAKHQHRRPVTVVNGTTGPTDIGIVEA